MLYMVSFKYIDTMVTSLAHPQQCGVVVNTLASINAVLHRTLLGWLTVC